MRILLAFLLLCSVAYGAPKERVINLPEDGDKWYLSVVGEGPEYQKILNWFKKGELKTLKSQVHFCQVTPKSPLWSRYKNNIKGMPTVRLQDAQGYVIYEVAADNIPTTATGLHMAMATTVSAKEILPWRRRNCRPQPDPQPQPDLAPNPLDPPPAPLNDEGGVPDLLDYSLWGCLACLVLLVVGSVWGQIGASRERRK